MIHIKQISKVVYEAIRAYNGTIGEPDQKSWEGATQAERDSILNKVEAILNGQPHGPTGIRPSEQIRAKLVTGITGIFYLQANPPVVYAPPTEATPPTPEIPVEVFPNPDVEDGNRLIPVSEAFDPSQVQTLKDAMAQADAHIAAADSETHES